jgi:CDP-4-dehydro-6-deoxyglucose reductase
MVRDEMPYRVALQPSGHTFEVPDDQSVLTAGLAAGWNLPYSCRLGMCRSCRAKIVEGHVDHGDYFEHVLTAEMRAQGFALLCRAKPLSDLVVEVQELSLQAQKPKLVPCRLKQITRPAPDVAVLALRLPQNENMRYAAGQYVDILLPDGKRRAYSIATVPKPEGVIDIELHVRHTPGGAFTDRVFSTMKERELLKFEGPLGTFYLREESDKPIIFLASGTGFAPIKSIIEYMLARKIARPMTLYWGCRTRADLYMSELPESWAQSVASFRYVPVLSEARVEDRWTGRSGLVHHAVMQDVPDLSGFVVYASGSPAMVEAARTDFTKLNGLPEGELFADAFITEADRASAIPESAPPPAQEH